MKMQFGSATTVISQAATLANGSNTYNGLTGCTMTQLDNSTDLYPFARAVLGVPDTFAAAPTAGSTIDLYMIVDDIDGNDICKTILPIGKAKVERAGTDVTIVGQDRSYLPITRFGIEKSDAVTAVSVAVPK